MRILGGSVTKDTGEIYIKGKKVEINNINDSLYLGISIIYQEFNLVPTLSVAENLFLGRLSKGRLVNWREITKKAKDLMDYLNFDISVSQKVQSLSVAEMQMVEIAKAFSYDSEIIIMDEPSATLTESELENFFNIIKSLNEKGITVIYISHRLEEIFRICDRVTILRDGKLISTMDVSEVDKNSIIEILKQFNNIRKNIN
jgi:ribose transport system ATP-binding protein